MEGSAKFALRDYLNRRREEVNEMLNELTPINRRSNDLDRAVRYSLDLDRGKKGALYAKRARPILTLTMAEEYHAPNELSPGYRYLALVPELIHASSLIFDDKMDGSDERRGRPATHIRFGDTTAHLAGLKLMNMATDLIGTHAPREYGGELSAEGGRVGQIMTDGQYNDTAQTMKSSNDIIQMYSDKSGELLALSARLGVFDGAGGWTKENAYKFGRQLGIAYQIADDFLDQFGDPKETGKDTHQDDEKLTILKKMGPNEARALALREKEKAVAFVRGHTMLEQLVGGLIKIPEIE